MSEIGSTLERYDITPGLPEQIPASMPERIPSGEVIDATLDALRLQIDEIFTPEMLKTMDPPPPKGEDPNDCTPNGHG